MSDQDQDLEERGTHQRQARRNLRGRGVREEAGEGQVPLCLRRIAKVLVETYMRARADDAGSSMSSYTFAEFVVSERDRAEKGSKVEKDGQGVCLRSLAFTPGSDP